MSPALAIPASHVEKAAVTGMVAAAQKVGVHEGQRRSAKADFEKHLARRWQQEIAAFENDEQAKGQAVLDRLWRERRELAEEEARIRRYLDPFNTGLYD